MAEDVVDFNNKHSLKNNLMESAQVRLTRLGRPAGVKCSLSACEGYGQLNCDVAPDDSKSERLFKVHTQLRIFHHLFGVDTLDQVEFLGFTDEDVALAASQCETLSEQIRDVECADVSRSYSTSPDDHIDKNNIRRKNRKCDRTRWKLKPFAASSNSLNSRSCSGVYRLPIRSRYLHEKRFYKKAGHEIADECKKIKNLSHKSQELQILDVAQDPTPDDSNLSESLSNQRVSTDNQSSLGLLTDCAVSLSKSPWIESGKSECTSVSSGNRRKICFVCHHWLQVGLHHGSSELICRCCCNFYFRMLETKKKPVCKYEGRCSTLVTGLRKDRYCSACRFNKCAKCLNPKLLSSTHSTNTGVEKVQQTISLKQSVSIDLSYRLSTDNNDIKTARSSISHVSSDVSCGSSRSSVRTHVERDAHKCQNLRDFLCKVEAAERAVLADWSLVDTELKLDVNNCVIKISNKSSIKVGDESVSLDRNRSSIKMNNESISVIDKSTEEKDDKQMDCEQPCNAVDKPVCTDNVCDSHVVTESDTKLSVEEKGWQRLSLRQRLLCRRRAAAAAKAARSGAAVLLRPAAVKGTAVGGSVKGSASEKSVDKERDRTLSSVQESQATAQGRVATSRDDAQSGNRLGGDGSGTDRKRLQSRGRVRQSKSVGNIGSDTKDSQKLTSKSAINVRRSKIGVVGSVVSSRLKVGKKADGKRARRCQRCVNCLKPDCGLCTECRDMPKFGGNGTLRQACRRRVCKNRDIVKMLRKRSEAKDDVENDDKISHHNSSRDLDDDDDVDDDDEYGEGLDWLGGGDTAKATSGAGKINEDNTDNKCMNGLRVSGQGEGLSRVNKAQPVCQTSAQAQASPIKADFKEDYSIEMLSERGLAVISSNHTSVLSLCKLCASLGKTEMLYCAACCDGFHLYCLDELSRPSDSASTDCWCCKKCLYCRVCFGRDGLIQCNRCKDTYHQECLGPSYPTKPLTSKRKTIWVCVKCIKCTSCGCTNLETESDMTSLYENTKCNKCMELTEKGNYCPICHKCYTDDDWDSKMIQCTSCHRWVHSKCEKLTDEMYEIVANMPEDVPFDCSICTPVRPSAWQVLVQHEMIEGMKKTLSSLCMTDCARSLAPLPSPPSVLSPPCSLSPSSLSGVQLISSVMDDSEHHPEAVKNELVDAAEMKDVVEDLLVNENIAMDSEICKKEETEKKHEQTQEKDLGSIEEGTVETTRKELCEIKQPSTLNDCQDTREEFNVKQVSDLDSGDMIIDKTGEEKSLTASHTAAMLGDDDVANIDESVHSNKISADNDSKSSSFKLLYSLDNFHSPTHASDHHVDKDTVSDIDFLSNDTKSSTSAESLDCESVKSEISGSNVCIVDEVNSCSARGVIEDTEQLLDETTEMSSNSLIGLNADTAVDSNALGVGSSDACNDKSSDSVDNKELRVGKNDECNSKESERGDQTEDDLMRDDSSISSKSVMIDVDKGINDLIEENSASLMCSEDELDAESIVSSVDDELGDERSAVSAVQQSVSYVEDQLIAESSHESKSHAVSSSQKSAETSECLINIDDNEICSVQSSARDRLSVELLPENNSTVLSAQNSSAVTSESLRVNNDDNETCTVKCLEDDSTSTSMDKCVESSQNVKDSSAGDDTGLLSSNTIFTDIINPENTAITNPENTNPITPVIQPILSTDSAPGGATWLSETAAALLEPSWEVASRSERMCTRGAVRESRISALLSCKTGLGGGEGRKRGRGVVGETPRDLGEISEKLKGLDDIGYASVDDFVVDVSRIIRYNLEREVDKNDSQMLSEERRDVISAAALQTKHSFIKHMEINFPWFKVNLSRFWCKENVLPRNLLEGCIPPPTNEHVYAEYLDKTKRSPPRHCRAFSGVRRGQAGVREGEDLRVCRFCNRRADDRDKGAGRLVYVGQDDWVHVNCALWSAEVYEESDGLLKMVHSALSRARNLRCRICCKPGSTVGCCMEQCSANFHFTCARRNGCVFTQGKQVFCSAHTQRAEGQALMRDEDFQVLRRVYVDCSEVKKQKKPWLTGLNHSLVSVNIGCVTVESLGRLSSLSDDPTCLIPLDFRMTRVYWSSIDARRRAIYTCTVTEFKPTHQLMNPESTSCGTTITHDPLDPLFDCDLDLKYRRIPTPPPSPVPTPPLCEVNTGSITSYETLDIGSGESILKRKLEDDDDDANTESAVGSPRMNDVDDDDDNDSDVIVDDDTSVFEPVTKKSKSDVFQPIPKRSNVFEPIAKRSKVDEPGAKSSKVDVFELMSKKSRLDQCAKHNYFATQPRSTERPVQDHNYMGSFGASHTHLASSSSSGPLGDLVSRLLGSSMVGLASNPSSGTTGGLFSSVSSQSSLSPRGGPQAGLGPSPPGGYAGGLVSSPRGGNAGGLVSNPHGGTMGGLVSSPRGGVHPRCIAAANDDDDSDVDVDDSGEAYSRNQQKTVNQSLQMSSVQCSTSVPQQQQQEAISRLLLDTQQRQRLAEQQRQQSLQQQQQQSLKLQQQSQQRNSIPISRGSKFKCLYDRNNTQCSTTADSVSRQTLQHQNTSSSFVQKQALDKEQQLRLQKQQQLLVMQHQEQAQQLIAQQQRELLIKKQQRELKLRQQQPQQMQQLKGYQAGPQSQRQLLPKSVGRRPYRRISVNKADGSVGNCRGQMIDLTDDDIPVLSSRPLPARETFLPATSREPFLPATGRELFQPDTSRETLIPATAREALRTAKSSDAFQPATSREVFLPATSTESFLAATTREAFLPATDRKPFLPSTARDTFLPATARESFRPATSREVFLPTPVREALRPATSREPYLPAPAREPFLSAPSRKPLQPAPSREAFLKSQLPAGVHGEGKAESGAHGAEEEEFSLVSVVSRLNEAAARNLRQSGEGTAEQRVRQSNDGVEQRVSGSGIVITEDESNEDVDKAAWNSERNTGSAAWNGVVSRSSVFRRLNQTDGPMEDSDEEVGPMSANGSEVGGVKESGGQGIPCQSFYKGKTVSNAGVEHSLQNHAAAIKQNSEKSSIDGNIVSKLVKHASCNGTISVIDEWVTDTFSNTTNISTAGESTVYSKSVTTSADNKAVVPNSLLNGSVDENDRSNSVDRKVNGDVVHSTVRVAHKSASLCSDSLQSQPDATSSKSDKESFKCTAALSKTESCCVSGSTSVSTSGSSVSKSTVRTVTTVITASGETFSLLTGANSSSGGGWVRGSVGQTRPSVQTVRQAQPSVRQTSDTQPSVQTVPCSTSVDSTVPRPGNTSSNVAGSVSRSTVSSHIDNNSVTNVTSQVPVVNTISNSSVSTGNSITVSTSHSHSNPSAVTSAVTSLAGKTCGAAYVSGSPGPQPGMVLCLGSAGAGNVSRSSGPQPGMVSCLGSAGAGGVSGSPGVVSGSPSMVSYLGSVTLGERERQHVRRMIAQESSGGDARVVVSCKDGGRVEVTANNISDTVNQLDDILSGASVQPIVVGIGSPATAGTRAVMGKSPAVGTPPVVVKPAVMGNPPVMGTQAVMGKSPMIITRMMGKSAVMGTTPVMGTLKDGSTGQMVDEVPSPGSDEYNKENKSRNPATDLHTQPDIRRAGVIQQSCVQVKQSCVPVNQSCVPVNQSSMPVKQSSVPGFYGVNYKGSGRGKEIKQLVQQMGGLGRARLLGGLDCDAKPLANHHMSGIKTSHQQIQDKKISGGLSVSGVSCQLARQAEPPPPPPLDLCDPDKLNKPHLRFEIRSDDGFSVQSDCLTKAWKAVTDSVMEARLTANMKPVSYAAVDGLTMCGLTHPAIVYLLEQLPGAHRMKQYSFKYHDVKSVDDLDDIEETEHGCSRAESWKGERRKYDMFSFLLSRYRRKPVYDPNSVTRVDYTTDTSQRRQTSLDLPMAMRFRHLREFSKEAVGVFRSHIHGRGLFCKKDIIANEMIIEYSGEVIRAILTDKREAHYESQGIGCYMFRKDRDHVIDSTVTGNAARFVNHSCEPNCYSKVIMVDNRKHIVIFAMRDIKRGEELTYDYKFPIEDVKLPCSCGSRKCRKYLN